jgi:inorganic phosphate transporter, PiT family
MGDRMIDPGLAIFVFAVALSYVYAFVGGFTDAANAIATSVGTRAFSPAQAVVVAGVFEMLGALTGTAVALTIGKGIIAPELLTQSAVVSALIGAMIWSLLTYRYGIPVSETHGLIGGIVGVGLAYAGPQAVNWGTVVPVLAAIFISPALGFLGGMLVLLVVYRTTHLMQRGLAQVTFMRAQQVSSIYMAFSHGRNDAQKPMGVLTMALAAYYGWTEVTVPLWVILSVAAVAALGVAAGGWRIIQTLGERMARLHPEQGFAAEMAAATVLQVASEGGIPVSTTHTITAAIVGAGTLRGWKRVRWGVVTEILQSWFLTVPATIAFGYVVALVVRFVLGGA